MILIENKSSVLKEFQKSKGLYGGLFLLWEKGRIDG
jgi:hypothetical protein